MEAKTRHSYTAESEHNRENERLAKKYKFPFLALLVHHFTLKFSFSSLYSSYVHGEIAQEDDYAIPMDGKEGKWKKTRGKKGKINVEKKAVSVRKNPFCPHQAFGVRTEHAVPRAMSSMLCVK